jgi:predicted lipoprotein
MWSWLALPRSRQLPLVVALALGTACGGGDGGSQPGAPDARLDGDGSVIEFDRRGLLRHLATNVLLPTYEAFADEAEALSVAVDAYCVAVGVDAEPTGDAAAALASAQDAWRGAMVVFQKADAVLVGPAAMDFKALRNRVYSWPLTSGCAVDQDVPVIWTTPASYRIEARLDNARSLSAVEYLLFNDPARETTVCLGTPTGWDAIRADLPKARCRLAAAIADDVAAQAEVLAQAWRPAGGNYVGQLVEAGTAASQIPSAQEALNLVSDGLFYADKMIKDMKLGEPAGIAMNSCGAIGTPCLAEVEHTHANHGRASLLANLAGLREVFTGTVGGVEGPGFDDYLRFVGAGELADRMTTSIDAAIAAVDAIPVEMKQAIVDAPTQVAAAHAAAKAITDDLKTQFLTVLGLDIPDDVAGDND